MDERWREEPVAGAVRSIAEGAGFYLLRTMVMEKERERETDLKQYNQF